MMPETRAQQICELFETELEIVVPSAATDLIEEGLLDSLVFVDLIVRLENQFDVEIPVAELEFDQFRTVNGIAQFIDSLTTKDSVSGQESAA